MVMGFQKVIYSLPGSITADTMYAVRVGSGFDFYISDSSGAVARPLNAQVKLPPPDLYAETFDYFYFGWLSLGGDWSVRRQERITGGVMVADVSNNSGEADLGSAWSGRAALSYRSLAGVV